MPKRNKVAMFLLLPIVVLLWSIGWILIWVGSKREARIPKPKLQFMKK